MNLPSSTRCAPAALVAAAASVLAIAAGCSRSDETTTMATPTAVVLPAVPASLPVVAAPPTSTVPEVGASAPAGLQGGTVSVISGPAGSAPSGSIGTPTPPVAPAPGMTALPPASASLPTAGAIGPAGAASAPIDQPPSVSPGASR